MKLPTWMIFLFRSILLRHRSTKDQDKLLKLKLWRGVLSDKESGRLPRDKRLR